MKYINKQLLLVLLPIIIPIIAGTVLFKIYQHAEGTCLKLYGEYMLWMLLLTSYIFIVVATLDYFIAFIALIHRWPPEQKIELKGITSGVLLVFTLIIIGFLFNWTLEAPLKSGNAFEKIVLWSERWTLILFITFASIDLLLGKLELTNYTKETINLAKESFWLIDMPVIITSILALFLISDHMVIKFNGLTTSTTISPEFISLNNVWMSESVRYFRQMYSHAFAYGISVGTLATHMIISQCIFAYLKYKHGIYNEPKSSVANQP